MIREIKKEEYFKVVELGKILKKTFNENQISSNENVFVYEYNQFVYGFIQISILYETLEIINIVVDESYRNKGIATSLLNFVVDKYKPEHVLLEVRENNLDAINFYKKNNYVEIRRIKNYYKDEDAIVMEKVLI